MRRAAPVCLLLLAAAPAAADTFGGFSGVDRPYLVNQDRVCTPIKVMSGQAAGAPACEKAGADVIARLSIKDPIVQRGPKAVFAASASGRTLTVTRRTGEALVTWQAMDPIGKVIEVYGSQYEDRVAVAFSVRRMGKEVTDVVAFDLGQGQSAVRDPAADPSAKDPNAKDPNAKDPSAKDPTAKDPNAPSTAPATRPPEDPKLTKAVAAARKAPRGARSMTAWQAVLAIDPAHAEARYGIAIAHAVAKAPADAVAALTALAASTRGDAIEWLVEARFEPAFAAVRADPRFRTAVGLDRPAGTAYEKLMGFGGQWEQSGTSCDRPEVRFTALRDRSFKIKVKSACEGRTYEAPFKGTWRLDGDRVVLGLPNAGKITAADEAACVFERTGDEDALHCNLGKDIEFSVLPTRR